MKLKSKREKKIFVMGIGLGSKKRKSSKKKIQTKPKAIVKKSKSTKPVYLGSTYVNGKFYDTNFKKPVEISKEELKDLRQEYAFDGKSTDKEVVDAFVGHMRIKYGSFDKNGKFLGLLSDE